MSAGHLALPDDIMRGIRAAHLRALQHVARRHADMLQRLHPQHHERADWPFQARAQAVLADQIEAWRGMRGNYTAARLAPLLGDLLKPGSVGGSAAGAETVALSELEHEVGFPAPVFFVEVFKGAGGWRDALALYLAELLRSDPSLRAELIPPGAIGVLAALERHQDIMLGVEPDLAQFADALAALLPELEAWRAGIEQRVEAAQERLERVGRLLEMAELALPAPSDGEDPEIDQILADQAAAMAAIAGLAGAPDADPGLELALRHAGEGDLAPFAVAIRTYAQRLGEPASRWLGSLLFFDDPLGAALAYRQALDRGMDDPWLPQLMARLEREQHPRERANSPRGWQKVQS